MKICYFSDDYVSWMRSVIGDNLTHYAENTFSAYFEEKAAETNGIKKSELPISLPALSLENATPNKDALSVRSIYSNMMELSDEQAMDERFWSYLTHIYYWEYMQKRWGVSSTTAKDKINFIRERYFLKTENSRWLIRNGISRLWWYGRLTYTTEDQWDLTDTLLGLQDIQAALLERTYGKNPVILYAALRVISEHRTEIEKRLSYEYGDLKVGFQQFGVYVGLLGGTTLLDSLNRSQIEMKIKKRFI